MSKALKRIIIVACGIVLCLLLSGCMYILISNIKKNQQVSVLKSYVASETKLAGYKPQDFQSYKMPCETEASKTGDCWTIIHKISTSECDAVMARYDMSKEWCASHKDLKYEGHKLQVSVGQLYDMYDESRFGSEHYLQIIMIK